MSISKGTYKLKQTNVLRGNSTKICDGNLVDVAVHKLHTVSVIVLVFCVAFELTKNLAADQ